MESMDELSRSFSKLSDNQPDIRPENSDFTERENWLNNFFTHVPSWGGQLTDENNYQVIFSNTCTIDYYLLTFWASWVLCNRPDNYLTNIHINSRLPLIITQILFKIDSLEWNNAKYIWMKQVIQLEIKIKRNGRAVLDAFGNTHDMCYKFIKDFQRHSYTITCSNGCINNQNTRNTCDIYMERYNGKVAISRISNCKACKKPIIQSELIFEHDPVWLFVQVNNGLVNNICFEELPAHLHLNGKSYKLLSATIFFPSNQHYRSIFLINNVPYLVDDLNSELKNTEIPKINVDFGVYFAE